MKRTLAWISPVVIVALAVWGMAGRRADTAERESRDAPLPSGNHLVHMPSGETALRLDPEAQARIGMQAGTLAPVALPAQVLAYGRLEEDPSRSFVVRAPAAGRLAADRYPGLGQTVEDGMAIGVIEPRIAPVDRVALSERLAAAQAELVSANAALKAARASYVRLKGLNEDNKNVSDRAVEEAEARMRAEEARAAAAAQAARVIESSLSATGGAIPLVAARGGQVVEIWTRPGESVEAGQSILRVAQFDRLLARVDIPVGERVSAAVASARILVLGAEDHPLLAQRIGPAPAVDPRTQGQVFLFRLADPGLELRPGLAVTAYLALPGPARSGVVVPRGAVVHLSGKAWVYVQTAPDGFVRREVLLEETTAGGWFTRSLAPGTRVVSTGAQALLSEELKSQIQVGEETPI